MVAARGAYKHVWGGLIRIYLKMLSINVSNMKGLGVSVTHDDGLPKPLKRYFEDEYFSIKINILILKKSRREELFEFSNNSTITILLGLVAVAVAYIELLYICVIVGSKIIFHPFR
jgi:hypothetical protein